MNMSKNASKIARSALNRVVIACQDEIMALNAAAPVLGGERGAGLAQQALRRATFRRDLSAGIVALGGVPARGGTYAATVRRGARVVRRVLSGAHDGDAYAACAEASANTARAYWSALALDLPSDVRFGVSRQYTEAEFDSNELRRRRFGAQPVFSAEINIDGVPSSQASSEASGPREREHTWTNWKKPDEPVQQSRRTNFLSKLSSLFH